jgi:hypothetical protein
LTKRQPAGISIDIVPYCQPWTVPRGRVHTFFRGGINRYLNLKATRILPVLLRCSSRAEYVAIPAAQVSL